MRHRLVALPPPRRPARPRHGGRHAPAGSRRAGGRRSHHGRHARRQAEPGRLRLHDRSSPAGSTVPAGAASPSVSRPTRSAPYGDAYVPVTTSTGAPHHRHLAEQRQLHLHVEARPHDAVPRRGAGLAAGHQRRPHLPFPAARRLRDRRHHATTPARGWGRRGTVRPEHDGARALIQRRSSSGRFVTVARATLRDAGTDFSRYSRRVRIRRDGSYRVKVARRCRPRQRLQPRRQRQRPLTAPGHGLTAASRTARGRPATRRCRRAGSVRRLARRGRR